VLQKDFCKEAAHKMLVPLMAGLKGKPFKELKLKLIQMRNFNLEKLKK